MVIPQGKSFKEWIECFDEMMKYQNNFDAIGISFHNDFFYDLGVFEFDKNYDYWIQHFEYNNIDVYYAIGRILLINYLNKNRNLSNLNKHIHLLGCHWPSEKKMYKNIRIDTWDSGFPVKSGILGEYITNIKNKPSIIIDNFIDDKLDSKTIEIIKSNIKMFNLW